MLVLPVMYVLSTGPACLLIDRKYASDEVIAFLVDFYWPVTLACNSSIFVGSAMEWYVSQWV